MLAAPKNSLSDMLDHLDALQVFPTAAIKVAEVARKRGSSLDDMERAVGMDPALTGRLLKLANSPFYGMSREVKTLKRAVQVLGFHATRDLAISSAMAAIGARTGELGARLWTHAVTSGAAANATASVVHGVDKHTAFVAGLLLDVGQLLLLAVERDAYRSLLRAFRHDADKLVKAERFHFGFDHAALGAACLRQWSLPDTICAGVEHHHGRSFSGNFVERLIPTLRLGDRIADFLQNDVPPAAIGEHLETCEDAGILGLDPRRISGVAERAARDAADFLKL